MKGPNDPMTPEKSENEDEIDDLSLFRDAMRHITPKEPTDKVSLRTKPSAIPKRRLASDTNLPKNKFALSDPSDSTSVLSDDWLFFARPGLSAKQIRHLKQGKIPLQGTLDLHGHDTESARIALERFINESIAQQRRYVMIIHGKGHTDTPVLKNKINHWLPQLPPVLAFCSALPSQGGTGSVYVLLKLSS